MVGEEIAPLTATLKSHVTAALKRQKECFTQEAPVFLRLVLPRRECSGGGPPRFLRAGIAQHQGLDRRSLRRPHALVGHHLLDPRLDVAAHRVCRRGFRLPTGGAVHTQRPTEGFAQCLGWEHTSAV